MTNQDLTTILDECITRIQAGEPVSACVRDYPEYAEQLWPMLDAAANLTTLPRPLIAAQGRQRGRERMLAQLAQNQPQPVSFLAFLRYAGQKIAASFTKERPNMKLLLRSAVTALCLLVLSTAIVAASQNSLPGDPLYPVKRSWEWVQGSFVPAPEQNAYKDELLLRRYQELELLMEAGRQVSFDLEGLLTGQTATTLQVAGFIIQTDAATHWLTLPVVGDSVQINLLVQSDGTLLARQVAVSDRPVPAMTATPTDTVTRTPNSCTGGVCPTATPTACPNPNCVTATPTRCNTPNCATSTPTPCTTSPNCVTTTATTTPCSTGTNCLTPTVTRTPNCNPANCPTPTATPWCGATICPTFTPTATPACNTGICPTKTPVPTITRTPNCTPTTCATATPVPTATPTACNTPNCQPPTATPTPGCNPANCPTATPTPGCSAGACPTPTPTACPSTPNCVTVTPTVRPPTATSTPGCSPSTCPTPTSTPGCNLGACPSPTPTQCNTSNCVTPTFTPPPGCSPANCNTPTPTPWCGNTSCPTPTTRAQGEGLHAIRFRFR